MKILAIRIKNLASLEGISVVDFTKEPLCSAGIFAITGPTGAGKSTILDALCLALYAKTPRYIQAKESGIDILDVQGSTISQGDPRGILRDGTGEGFAEVDFVGVDGLHYAASWNVKRARNKADGRIQSDTTELKNLTSNIVIPGKKTDLLKEIERLVGLNFEQFTRSVLLAQGDFTAFLKASKDEKSSLLEKLTGTHIYSEISKLIFEKYKLAEQELRELNLKKEGIVTLTDEEIQTLSDQKKTFEDQIRELDKEIQNLTNELGWHQQLSELLVSIGAAEADLAKAEEIKNKVRERILKLAQIEQVQVIRTNIASLSQSREQLVKKSGESAELDKNLLSIREQSEQTEIQFKDSEFNLAEETRRKDESTSLLSEAKRLDTLITEKKQQREASKKDWDDTKLSYTQLELQLEGKKVKALELSGEIEKQTIWKKENELNQPIATNINLIVSKVADARKILEKLDKLIKDIDGIKKTNTLLVTEKNTLDNAHSAKGTELESIRKSWDIQSKELQLIPINSLESEKLIIDKALEEAITAQAHWKLLFSTLNDSDVLKNKLKLNEEELSKKEGLFKIADQQLSVLKVQKETFGKLLQKAQLDAAENVESLRTSLILDEPCPVCGSKEHPYVKENAQLDKVLQGISEEFRECENKYEACLKEHSNLHDSCERLPNIIRDQKQELELKENSLRKLQEDWTKFDIQQQCISLPNEKIGQWIDERLLTTKQKQSSTQKQISAYDSAKKALELQKSKIELLEKKLSDISERVKDLNRTILSNQENEARNLQLKENSNTDLSEIEKSISKYFPNQDWLTNWKNDPDSFINKIKGFSEQWELNSKKLDQNSQQHNIMLTIITGTETQLKDFSGEVNKKEQIFEGLDQNFQQLSVSRNAIFGGESVEVIEERLNLSIKKAQDLLNTLKLRRDELNIEIAKEIARKDQLVKDIKGIEQSVNEYSEKIQQWVNEYNEKNFIAIDYEQIVLLLSYSHEWMQLERAALKAIDDKVTETLSILNERKEKLIHHENKRFSNRSLEELKELHNSIKSSLDMSTQSQNGIVFQLRQDELNKKQIGDLLKVIEGNAKITDNWSKLNDIIGSADGKKFRQIAQEYTLEVLLIYANIHLEVLSKRYLIQRIPASLGLQVIDQDMGNEVRTVYSLSGGESFLVSLALALGLASLSSNRMKVESLFIDEGFGSLDPTTLNIAMDALERLHNQGRKVGLISHVQEMTERIPTQIKVSKLSNGRSKIQVI